MSDNPSDAIAGSPTRPAVGDTISIPIVTAPTKTTVFAEQAIVATSAPSQLEIIFLRLELMMGAQMAKVSSYEGEGMTVEVQANNVIPQLCDIGHVRLPPQVGLELAVNLLNHVVQNHGTSWEEIDRRLTPLRSGSTSQT